jgi:hypothetical protein
VELLREKELKCQQRARVKNLLDWYVKTKYFQLLFFCKQVLSVTSKIGNIKLGSLGWTKKSKDFLYTITLNLGNTSLLLTIKQQEYNCLDDLS